MQKVNEANTKTYDITYEEEPIMLREETIEAIKEMDNQINIPHTQIVLAFVATCIEATARTLGVSYKEVFMRMKRLGMIENYIIPNYGVLHTESRENIALDMIECMNVWEAKA